MSAALRERMTPDAFLAWERVQELPYECDGTGSVATNGGALTHGQIAFRAARCIQERLANRSCFVFTSGVKVLVDACIRYPDVVVTCAAFGANTDIVPDPVVVIEVLSPSTASDDRIQKNAEYAATPSIQHCVMLEQTRRGATVFSRNGDDWAGHIVLGEGVLLLPTIGVELPLAEICGGLTLNGADQ